MNLPFSLDFTAPAFLLAVAVLAALSRLLPRKALPTLLLCASVLYYVCLAPAAMPVLTLATVCVYFSGLGTKRSRGAAAAVGIVGVLLLLCVTKYLPSLWQTLFNKSISVLTPLGISYFTFSAVSYLADVKSGKTEPCRSFSRVALYLLFFPKITSGPIEKANIFFEKIETLSAEAEKPWRYREGVLLILCGCLRKLAVSNVLADAVASVFDAPDGQTGFAVLLAAVLYAFQIYGDFAGYTDIARGSALLLGVSMTENFNRPYLATDMKDFWRRWHISLSSWLKDYVYIPLGGNRKGTFRKYLNVFITFAVSGVWHGAGLTFLIWGALHGLLQIIEGVLPWRDKLKKRVGASSLLYKIPAVAVTFILVVLCWIPFRAGSIGNLWQLVCTFGNSGSLVDAVRRLGLTVGDLALVVLALVVSDRLKRIIAGEVAVSVCFANGKERNISADFPFYVLIMLAVLLLMLLNAKNGSGGGFIYINF